jgi:NADPH2:quinone reductase
MWVRCSPAALRDSLTVWFTDTAQLFDLIKSNTVKIVVHKTYTLDQAGEAHSDLGGGKTTGKLLIKI